MHDWLQTNFSSDLWTRTLVMIIDCGLKGMVLLALAALVTLAMRRSSAASRHLVWGLALGGLLLLPCLSLIVPKWQLPILPQATAPDAPFPETNVSIPSTTPSTVSVHTIPSAPSHLSPSSTPSISSTAPNQATPSISSIPLPMTFWILAVWLAVSLAMLTPLMAGLAFVARLISKARPLVGEDWPELTRTLAMAMGLRRPVRILCGGREAMPMATGLMCPTILLPAEADTWPEEKRRAVLLHELAHVKRRDCLIHALGRLATALHWFNPLAWVALRRLRIERERACDDLVITAGERASTYSEYLLDIARTMQTGALISAAAITMAKKSQLEGRLLAILDATCSRRALTRRMLAVSTFAVVFVVYALAVVQLGARESTASRGLKTELATAELTFNRGVTARLMAVAMHPRRGAECWAPDGAPLSQVPAGFEKIDGRVTPSKDQIAREFYISIDHPAYETRVDATCEVTSAGTTGGGTFGNVSGHILIHRQAVLPAGMEEATLRIGVAAGAWEALVGASREGGGQNFTRHGQPHSIVFSKALQDGDKVTLTVSDDISDVAKGYDPDYQIVAIDKVGKVRQPNQNGSNMGHFRQTTCKFDKLKLDQIERFEFQVRDYEWREIKGIRLEPNIVRQFGTSAMNSGTLAKKPRTLDYTFKYERRIFGKSAQAATSDTQGMPDEAMKTDTMKRIMKDQILKQKQRVQTDGTSVRYEVLEDLGSPTDPQNPQVADQAKKQRTNTYIYDGKAMADINRFENTATIMPTGFAYPNLSLYMSSPVNASAYTSIELRDIRMVKGYQIPFQIVAHSSQMEEKITIEKIDADISFEDGIFDIANAIPPGTNVADTREKPMKEYKMPANPMQLDSTGASATASSTCTLQFPAGRSVGWLSIRNPGEKNRADWKPLGAAQGAVAVPAGKEVMLKVEGNAIDLSPLEKLNKNALNTLYLSGPGLTDNDLKPLAGLSGLKDFTISSGNMSLAIDFTGAGLAYLKGFSSLESLMIQSSNLNDAGLARLKQFPNLKTLLLWNDKNVTPTGWAALKDLHSLKDLALFMTPLTDQGMQQIKELKGLESLGVEHAGVTPAGVLSIAEMSGLKSLGLYAEIPGSALAPLKRLPNLESLTVGEVVMTDDDLAAFAGFASIKKLDLRLRTLTGAGLKHLRSLPKLEEISVFLSKATDESMQGLDGLKVIALNLDLSKVGDAGLAHLKGMASLEQLFLSDTQITDTGLVNLANLTSLRLLHMDRTLITDKGLAQLKGLGKLSDLWLRETETGDASMEMIGHFEKLSQLALDKTKVTDAGIKFLNQHSNLQILNLNGTQVSDQSIPFIKTMPPSFQFLALIKRI